MSLLGEHRGTDITHDYISGIGDDDDTNNRVRLHSTVPLQELVDGAFHDKLQSATNGTCSYSYEPAGYHSADIVLVRVLVNGDPADALSFLSHSTTARPQSLHLLAHLKTIIAPHQFDITLQASVNNKIVAREGVKAVRKDVTAKCYGGDGSRKKKLLEKQRDGKAKLRQIGRVSIDSDRLADLMRFK
jgi:GTP-binding protein LepA